MIYVWAMEQAQRHFAAQDVLVPWHLVKDKPGEPKPTHVAHGTHYDSRPFSAPA